MVRYSIEREQIILQGEINMKKYRLYARERKAILITEDINELESTMDKTKSHIVKVFDGKKLVDEFLASWKFDQWFYDRCYSISN